DDLVVQQLLDAMQRLLPLLPIEDRPLLAYEALDVGIAAVHVGAACGDEPFDARGRRTVRSAAALDDVLELFLRVLLEEAGSLERAQPRADADGPEVVDDGLGDIAVGGVAGVVTGVEALGEAGLGQELLGLRGVVGGRRRR